jgi:hypothetical protein
VFCTHGNEVDDWNVVDHGKLGELANAINAGRAVDRSRWEPNSGTRLVVDVMNYVKTSYPFVDLLKPETAALASVLLAIDRDTFKRIDIERAFPVLKDKIKGGLVVRNLLSAEATTLNSASPRATADEAVEQLLGPSLREAVRGHSGRLNRNSEDELLRRASSTLGARPEGPGATGAAAVDTLGAREVVGTAWELFASRIGAVPTVEAARRALEDWLFDDKTFDVNAATDDGGVYERMQDRVGGSVDFVITGHTHLPRALPLRRGSGYYYNSGTWIRTLRLTPQALEPKAFKERVWPVLIAKRMSALDEAMIPGKGGKDERLVWDRTNAVRISSQKAAVVGDLLRVVDGRSPGTVKLDLEEHTQSFKVG